MKKYILAAAAFFMGVSAFAQQALWGFADVTSPEINADKTVTFRIKAPKAVSVQVTGDMLPSREIQTPQGVWAMPGVADLKEGKDGVWEYTTEAPVAPEFYNYNFIVDGQSMVDPNNVFINRDVKTLTSILYVEGDPIIDLFKVAAVPHGTVSKMWYHSEQEGYDRRLTVYTPAGYETSGKKYPVFYLLHGMGGDEEAWYTQGRASQILDNLIAQGKAEPMIVVMTNGNIAQQAAPGEGPDGFKAPDMALPKTMEGSFESAFPEVVKFVEKNFRVKADKKSRAIAGLSMGGFHSLHISKQYPDMFGYVGLFSAAIINSANSPIYEDFDGKLATQFAKKPALYYIAIGKTDFLYQANTEYRQKLDAAGYPYVYVETEGGHIWRNWRHYLADFAPRLFK